jgi:hypothetical protein
MAPSSLRRGRFLEKVSQFWTHFFSKIKCHCLFRAIAPIPENEIHNNTEETLERKSVHCKEVLQQRGEKRGRERGEKRREEESSTSGDRSSANMMVLGDA